MNADTLCELQEEELLLEQEKDLQEQQDDYRLYYCLKGWSNND